MAAGRAWFSPRKLGVLSVHAKACGDPEIPSAAARGDQVPPRVDIPANAHVPREGAVRACSGRDRMLDEGIPDERRRDQVDDIAGQAASAADGHRSTAGHARGLDAELRSCRSDRRREYKRDDGRCDRPDAQPRHRRRVARREERKNYMSSGFTTPITCPSGSLNWPISIMSMIFSGPITRVPPRLSAFWSASSMSGTAT
jgi:hypothetical protein